MTPPAPGILHLIRGRANPHGAQGAELYLLAGDASAGPITQIIPGPDVQIPTNRLSLDHSFRLKLLHFNDLHGHISCFDHGEALPVFSRMAARIKNHRRRTADNPRTGVLVVSGGDEIGGAIFDELLGDCPESYDCHAGYRLCTFAGVDVGVLGNHDFDRGATLLTHAIRNDAGFPLLAANAASDSPLAKHISPAALIVLKGLRIGIIGLTTPAQIHPELSDELTITDPVDAACNLIPALRPLCDVLIILSHLGYSLDQQTAGVLVAGDVELAAKLPPDSVHLIIGAHTHNALNEQGLSAANIVNDIPIVQAGKMGQFIGEVDITVAKNAAGGSAAAVTHARLTATADLPVDAAFEAHCVRPLLERAQPHWDRVLGRTENDPDLCTDVIRNELAAGENALANFITDGLAEQCRTRGGFNVDFAMIDASSIRCGLPLGGEFTYGDWFNLMPFADTLCLLRLSGRQILALLQDNALRVDRPGQPHLERGFIHFGTPLRYTIDLGPTRVLARPLDITLSGEPIENCLDRTYTIATSNFLRGPARAWETVRQDRYGHLLFDLSQIPRQATHLYIRELLVAHISAHGGVLPAGGAQRDGRLRILDSVIAKPIG